MFMWMLYAHIEFKKIVLQHRIKIRDDCYRNIIKKKTTCTPSIHIWFSFSYANNRILSTHYLVKHALCRSWYNDYYHYYIHCYYYYHQFSVECFCIRKTFIQHDSGQK